MATLTDEEKAKAVAGGETESSESANAEQPSSQQIEDQANQDAAALEQSTAAEKPPAEEDTGTETPPTLTKQFTNLKGETWEEYGPEVEKAYQNSFTEALRLKQELDRVTDEAKRLVTQIPDEDKPASPNVDVSSIPEVQYAKAQMQKDMVDAFDSFAKDYPQAREQVAFEKFSKASAGVYQAFEAANGRMPTYPELYSGIAKVLGWDPVNPKKDAAMKDAGAQGAATSSGSLPTSKQPRVTTAQVDAYLRMFPHKSRPDAVKELSEVV